MIKLHPKTGDEVEISISLEILNSLCDEYLKNHTKELYAPITEKREVADKIKIIYEICNEVTGYIYPMEVKKNG